MPEGIDGRLSGAGTTISTAGGPFAMRDRDNHQASPDPGWAGSPGSAPARHVAGRGPAGMSPALILAALLALLLVGWLSVSFLSSRLGRHGCAHPVSVQVLAAPSVARFVSEVAQTVPRHGGCVQLGVTEMDSAIVLDRLRSAPSTAAGGFAGGAGPAVWIPESTWWLQQAQQGGVSRTPTTGPSVAGSPVVLAAGEQLAATAGWPSRPLAASDLIGPDAPAVPVGIVDPSVDPTGLAAVLEVQALARRAGRTGPPTVELLRRLSLNVMPAATDAFSRLTYPAATGGSGAGAGATGIRPLQAVVTSEAAVVAYNAQHSTGRLVAVYPDASAPTLDYPFVVLPGTGDAQRSVAQTLLGALLNGRAEAARGASGLRPPDGTPFPAARRDPHLRADRYPPVPWPGDGVVTPVLNQWAGVNRTARLLGVIDVSGSMKQPAAGGMSRLAVTVHAAEQGLAWLRPGTDVGFWEFSTNLDGARPYRQVFPVSRLPEHRPAAVKALASLRPSKGDTALYDTTLAAYRSARDNFTPGRLNLVVLATDGYNDNPAGGLALDELLAQLRRLADPGRPIPIIAIGIGKDADRVSLERITAATGGRTYITRDGSDIEKVFFNALGSLIRGDSDPTRADAGPRPTR